MFANKHPVYINCSPNFTLLGTKYIFLTVIMLCVVCLCIHHFSERIFLFVSSRFLCLLTDHFCLFTTQNRLSASPLRATSCLIRQLQSTCGWLMRSHIPARVAEWCCRQIDADTYDRPQKTTCDRRVEERRHGDELRRKRDAVFRRNQPWSQGKFRPVYTTKKRPNHFVVICGKSCGLRMKRNPRQFMQQENKDN